MLTELPIEDLGVIERAATSCSGPGMTALTGETGAGKTMLVEAIDLLVGGRADAAHRARRAPPRPRSRAASSSATTSSC